MRQCWAAWANDASGSNDTPGWPMLKSILPAGMSKFEVIILSLSNIIFLSHIGD